MDYGTIWAVICWAVLAVGCFAVWWAKAMVDEAMKERHEASQERRLSNLSYNFAVQEHKIVTGILAKEVDRRAIFVTHPEVPALSKKESN